MSFFDVVEAGPLGGSARIARGPVGTDAELLDPFGGARLLEYELMALGWGACLLRASSTSF